MTYLIFYFLDSFYDFFCTACVLTSHVFELFIQVELHITHFEIVTSYFKTAGQLAVLQYPYTHPFSSPKRL